MRLFKSLLQSEIWVITVNKSLLVCGGSVLASHCSVRASSIFCGTGTVVSVFMILVGCGNVADEVRNRIRDALQRPILR